MSRENRTPAPSLRERVRTLIEGAPFERSITALIIANAVTLGIETSPAIAARFGESLYLFDRLVLVHDAAITLGASCPPPQPEVTTYALDDMLVTEKMLISYGGEVNALGGNKFGGYLVRFSTPNDPDLVGDFFTADTDFDMEFPGRSTVYFNHGLDPKIKQRKLGKADLRLDEFGIWAETILQERDEYERFLVSLGKRAS